AGFLAGAVLQPRVGTSPGHASSHGRIVDGVNLTGFPTGGKNAGIFTDTCRLAKTAPNDPIMMPGMPGMSMQHNFFGNTGTGAGSTPAGLVGGTTTCSTTADASAYWTPVLYQNGQALTPKSALIYWKSTRASTASSVKTMPAGMSIIAGDESATKPQSKKLLHWSCTLRKGEMKAVVSTTPRDCPAGSDLRLVVSFPTCWNGTTLNGKAQQNVVYEERRAACPASHPIRIPLIVVHVSYPTSSAAGLTLSTGPTTAGSTDTAHADFMNGWTQKTLDADVTACIDTQTRCGHTSGADATPRGGIGTRH
ncbi:MAG: DUF1996 domain-containing protein, partial [Candidatus Dormibacteraceae bacterium]